MILRNSINLLLVFILTLPITSCEPNPPHEDAVTYYTTIALQMKEFVPKVQTFFGEIKQGVITARENQDHKLDNNDLDRLNESLSRITMELEARIQTINSLKETDKELGFKQAIISYLTETKQLQEKSIPKILELLETGLDKIKDQHKEALEQFALKGQELQVQSREIEALSLKYQKKHNITNDELTRYGL